MHDYHEDFEAFTEGRQPTTTGIEQARSVQTPGTASGEPR